MQISRQKVERSRESQKYFCWKVLSIMSFVFRGTRADIDNGFPGFMPERRAMRMHAARPVNTNSLAFLVTVLLLFMILNSHQMTPNFMLWLVFGAFLMATSLRMYATCQQLQAQAQAHAVAASGLLGHTELRLHMPPSIALATRGRLQGLRLQLALLDREFDDLDYETLRALDVDNAPSVPSMSDEEINALPVHKYKVVSAQSSGPSVLQASSSAPSEQKKHEISIPVSSTKCTDDDLTCTVCLEQVSDGEIIRSLPCLHQFHAICIDPWLRQQGTCPVCKFKVGSGWNESAQAEEDASYMGYANSAYSSLALSSTAPSRLKPLRGLQASNSTSNIRVDLECKATNKSQHVSCIT
ncbi:hypothetical protein V2J09_023371 [Rumex salicifolius]